MYGAWRSKSCRWHVNSVNFYSATVRLYSQFGWNMVELWLIMVEIIVELWLRFGSFCIATTRRKLSFTRLLRLTSGCIHNIHRWSWVGSKVYEIMVELWLRYGLFHGWVMVQAQFVNKLMGQIKGCRWHVYFSSASPGRRRVIPFTPGNFTHLAHTLYSFTLCPYSYPLPLALHLHTLIWVKLLYETIR